MESETMHIPESEAVARVVVERRGTLDGTVTFSWRSAPGTALENDDYAAFGWATETMTAGQSTATLLVPIVRDSEQEETETFYIEITEPKGQARLGALTRTTVVIEDDDALQLVGR
jgi:Calx-beta domain